MTETNIETNVQIASTGKETKMPDTKKTEMNEANPQYMTIQSRVSWLVEKREAWETGALRASNKELYGLLGDCLALLLDLRQNREKCKIFYAHLEDLKIFNEASNLSGRIVRAVFGTGFKSQASRYARVIRIAADEKPNGETMTVFLTRHGGIESLISRRSNGKSPSEERRDCIRFAKEHLEQPGLHIENSPRDFSEAGDHRLFIWIMRQDKDDGSCSPVYEIMSESVLNAALALAGKELGTAEKNASAEQERRQNAAAGSKAVKDAAAAAAPAGAMAGMASAKRDPIAALAASGANPGMVAKQIQAKTKAKSKTRVS